MRRTGKYIVRWLVGTLSMTLFASGVCAQQPAPRPTPQRTPQSPTAPQAAAPSLPIAQSAPAQPLPAAQPTLSNAPQRTTATYDDWIVQCETQAGPPARKLCEMTQLTQLQVQGKTQPYSRVAVPHPVKDMPNTLIIQLPVNVSFSTNVKIQSSDNDQGVTVPFARCVPDGCFAEFTVKEDALGKFRSAGAGGKLSFADAGGRPVSVPMSFNGFGKAYDALLKE